ncbi:MAG: DUF1846 domain-containing protein [Oscillospiraceae bacterium]|nr:DUF1846 domain-containing protein [Oscillospiraceae bacterium]
MVTEIGFDNNKYIKLQSEQIGKRIDDFGGKLYLEFGGKLFDDNHAARVLTGFAPDSKLQMLQKLSGDCEIVIVINAEDIENNRMRSYIGITYDTDVLRLIDSFQEIGLFVGSVVISQYRGQSSAMLFKSRLETQGIKVFMHYIIPGYPYNVALIVSDEGYGKNDYIETTRPLVVITAPGSGSGKMATCLSQLYHENKRGVKAGYAKFETFPIWNLPLKHPVNLAYEAATADINDVNMIDPYHLDAYGETAVNYNRDVEIFPVLNVIFENITGISPYKSPTDMGVNMAGYCICNNELVCKAAYDEIIRRYFLTMCDLKRGRVTSGAVSKIELLMKQSNISVDDRKVVPAAIKRSMETGDQPAVAIELLDGRIITGKNSELLGAASAALLNATKALGNIDKSIHLIAPEAIEPIQKLKVGILGNKNPRLHSDEALIALSISASENEYSKLATRQLEKLRGCEAHSTVILAQVDEDTYRKLGINLTCEPHYNTNKLFHK